jgi:flagellar motility protein MotE (MotC chaperone)
MLLPCFLLSEALAKANKRADDLAVNLERSEKAREKAEQDAAAVGDLRKRLHQAETTLSEKVTQQIAREEDIIGRLESQNRRFVSKFVNHFARVSSKIISPHIY